MKVWRDIGKIACLNRKHLIRRAHLLNIHQLVIALQNLHRTFGILVFDDLG